MGIFDQADSNLRAQQEAADLAARKAAEAAEFERRRPPAPWVLELVDGLKAAGVPPTATYEVTPQVAAYPVSSADQHIFELPQAMINQRSPHMKLPNHYGPYRCRRVTVRPGQPLWWLKARTYNSSRDNPNVDVRLTLTEDGWLSPFLGSSLRGVARYRHVAMTVDWQAAYTKDYGQNVVLDLVWGLPDLVEEFNGVEWDPVFGFRDPRATQQYELACEELGVSIAMALRARGRGAWTGGVVEGEPVTTNRSWY